MAVDTSEAVRIFMDKQGGSDGSVSGNVINQIKDSATYDPNVGMGDPKMTNATKAQKEAKKLPGAFWDHMGTTQFNPLRSDPRVEAILGELRYSQSVSKDSPEEMRLSVAQLQQQVETLTKLLGAQVKKEEPEIVTTVNETPDYENMPYADLLVVVKSMYPDVRGRPKKEDILRMIANKEGR